MVVDGEQDRGANESSGRVPDDAGAASDASTADTRRDPAPDAGHNPDIAAVLEAAANRDPAHADSEDEERASAKGKPENAPLVRLDGVVEEIDPTPARAGVDFQQVIRNTVLDEVRVHAETAPDREVCGVLVGTVYESAGSNLVYIDAAIRGNGAANRGTSVTFTADTWQHIDRVMDREHPGKRIVGWYHSHPGFGIFLSEMDLFIQRSFFSAPWQTAFVYDPKSRENGLFAWRSGETKRVEFAIDDGNGTGDGTFPTLGAEQALSSGHGEDPSVQPGTIAELTERVQSLERRLRLTLLAATAVALLTIVWPLVVLIWLPDRTATPPVPVKPSAAPATRPAGPEDDMTERLNRILESRTRPSGS